MPQDTETKECIEQTVIWKWMRIHMDIEGYHKTSFPDRIKRMTIEQLLEMEAWILTNIDGLTPGKPPLPPPGNEKPEWHHEPMGPSSQKIRDPKQAAIIIDEYSSTSTQELPSMPIPQASLDQLWSSYSAAWEQDIPPEKRPAVYQMFIGLWLRFHLEVEHLPIETFFPRIHDYSPKLWTDDFNDLATKCAHRLTHNDTNEESDDDD